MKTLSIIVSGKVQGVYFRQSTKKLAEQLLLTGTVKNLDNGDVEIIATGTEEQLQALLSWCRKGPSGARVENITQKVLELRNHEDFRIVR